MEPSRKDPAYKFGRLSPAIRALSPREQVAAMILASDGMSRRLVDQHPLNKPDPVLIDFALQTADLLIERAAATEPTDEVGGGIHAK